MNRGGCFATLMRLLRDFDLAEEAMHEAFATAAAQWVQDGLPDNPVAWLISTGRFKAIDIIRRRQRFGEMHEAVLQRMDEIRTRMMPPATRRLKTISFA